MTFAWPLLLLLLVLPAALAAWELARRRRQEAAGAHPKILRAEAGQHHVRLVAGSAAPATRPRARWWLIAGLSLALVALARPQWGRLDEPVFDQSREILLALDLSKSMLTPDVKPSRLERSKLLIQSLLDRLEGERVGLAVFSGTAFLQSPLSADYEILREFLPALKPDFMPEGGTDYGDLIDTAAAAFGDSAAADRFLIVLSDGGATDGDWRSHVAKLKQKGIRVIGLGVGTAAGAMIPDGAGGLVKDDRGAVVMSRLENETLKELADQTGGTYRDASEWIDLAGLLQATVEAGRKGRFVEKNNVRHVERYQWALAPALLCLLLSFWREFPVRPRPRDLALGPVKPPRSPPILPAAALAVALLLVGAVGARAQTEATPPDAVASAPLAHIVGRVAAADLRSARDWADLSTETVAWGGRIQTAGQPVPAGPVEDALASVDAGAALDPHAADWSKLRTELEGFLKKPTPPPQDQQQQQKPPQQKKENQSQSQQQQQKQDQQKQDQQQGQPSSSQSQTQQEQQKQPADPEDQDSPGQPQGAGHQPKPPAFGQMNQPPPPGARGTQKVGGKSEHAPPDAAKADPSLAGSLEKLDQIRGEDSPPELFKMMENNEPRPKNAHPGKDW